MTTNMGTIDRLLRGALVAPLLVVAAVLLGVTTPVGIIALVAAVVMLATAATGSCPLYLLFGVDTCRSTGTR